MFSICHKVERKLADRLTCVRSLTLTGPKSWPRERHIPILIRKKLRIHVERGTACRRITNGRIVVLTIDEFLKEGFWMLAVSLHLRICGTGNQPPCSRQQDQTRCQPHRISAR